MREYNIDKSLLDLKEQTEEIKEYIKGIYIFFIFFRKKSI